MTMVTWFFATICTYTMAAFLASNNAFKPSCSSHAHQYAVLAAKYGQYVQFKTIPIEATSLHLIFYAAFLRKSVFSKREQKTFVVGSQVPVSCKSVFEDKIARKAKGTAIWNTTIISDVILAWSKAVSKEKRCQCNDANLRTTWMHFQVGKWVGIFWA